MKKIFVLFSFVQFAFLATFAQYTIQIGGSVFNVELDEQNMTAAIIDYNYEIDDVKFPINNKVRKFKDFRKENTKTLIIPNTYKTVGGKEYSITTIGRAAFAGYQNMDYVIIPTSVTTIEDYAFFRTSLVNVEIPASVVHLGKRVFGWCTKLKSLKLPQGIAMGTDLYNESKNIAVRYYTIDMGDNISQPNPKLPQPKSKSVTISTPSDVDTDLPLGLRQNDETFAIIIANENYQKVAHVDCALNDGRTFYKYCQQVLGIPEDNIHMVEDATSGQMIEQIVWLSRVAKVYEGEAKIIIYYAGHGVQNEKDRSPYLLPVDISGDNTSAAYSLHALYKELGSLNAKNVTLFIDACFSGSIRGEGMLASARAVARAAKDEAPLGNMIVFSAAQGDETAFPYAEKGHGLFTYFLLKKLKETKGNVSYGVLGDYIKKEVSRKSIVVNDKPQTPDVQPSPQMGDKWRGLTFK